MKKISKIKKYRDEEDNQKQKVMDKFFTKRVIKWRKAKE